MVPFIVTCDLYLSMFTFGSHGGFCLFPYLRIGVHVLVIIITIITKIKRQEKHFQMTTPSQAIICHCNLFVALSNLFVTSL